MFERWKQEIDFVEAQYGALIRAPNLDWFVILRFPLPPGWNKAETTLAIRLPPGYPTTQPYAFLVDDGVRLGNGAKPTNADFTQFESQQWLQFSFAVDEWQSHSDAARGHNLLTFLIGVKRRLMEVN